MADANNQKSVRNIHNLARFFTEQRQVAWVALGVRTP